VRSVRSYPIIALRWSEAVDRDQGMLATIPDLDVSAEGSGLVELRGDGTYSFTPDYSVLFTAGDETGTGEWS
jgi:hypothetical protein